MAVRSSQRWPDENCAGGVEQTTPEACQFSMVTGEPRAEDSCQVISFQLWNVVTLTLELPKGRQRSRSPRELQVHTLVLQAYLSADKQRRGPYNSAELVGCQTVMSILQPMRA